MGKLKILKYALPCALALGVTFSLLGCTDGNKDDNTEKEEPTPPPEVVYTVDESLAGSNVNPNDARFAPENVTPHEESPLEGMTFYFLGSSVTYGSASEQDSMADYIAALNNCTVKKEAVSGTTIFDDGGNGDSGVRSYTRRMVNSTVFDKNENIDAFICQISTNDCTSGRLDKWGEITADDVFDMESFDRGTTLGGIEYIIAYVIETWGCPVYFYSGAYFGDVGVEDVRNNANPKGSDYGRLVEKVNEVAEKWNAAYENMVGVIDMYNDADFNAAVSDEYYEWATSDAIHPRRAGYLQWWTPYFENFLIVHLGLY